MCAQAGREAYARVVRQYTYVGWVQKFPKQCIHIKSDWPIAMHYVERLTVKLTVRYLADSGFKRAIGVSIGRKKIVFPYLINNHEKS